MEQPLTPRQIWALLEPGGEASLRVGGQAYPVSYAATRRQGRVCFALTGVPAGLLAGCTAWQLVFDFDTLEGDARVIAWGEYQPPHCPCGARVCLVADRLVGRVRLRPADCRPADCQPCPEPKPCPRPCPEPKPHPRPCPPKPRPCRCEEGVSWPEPGPEDGRCPFDWEE